MPEAWMDFSEEEGLSMLVYLSSTPEANSDTTSAYGQQLLEAGYAEVPDSALSETVRGFWPVCHKERPQEAGRGRKDRTGQHHRYCAVYDSHVPVQGKCGIYEQLFPYDAGMVLSCQYHAGMPVPQFYPSGASAYPPERLQSEAYDSGGLQPGG